MTAKLPTPPASAWNVPNISTWGTGYIFRDAPDMELTVDNLVPGHTVKVFLKVLTYHNNVTAVIDDQVIDVPTDNYKDVTATVTLKTSTLTIRLLGSKYVFLHTFTLEDMTAVPAYPIPADVISVQAYYPQADLDGLRLDTSRWNRARFNLNAAPDRSFIWNTSRWDTRPWHSPTDTYAWQDITARIHSIQTTKGVNATGPILSADVGTLTLEAVDALDPRATGLTYGTPIKVIHWPTREVIWHGAVSDIAMEYAPPGSTWTYRTTISAADNVAALSAVTRYGARADGGDGSETWNARIARLMKSAPNVPYNIPSQSHTLMCATVWETNLAAHLDAATASVNGMWHVDRNNIVQITAARPSLTPDIVFTDTAPTDPTARRWSFHTLNVTWKASEVAAAVYLTNHGAKHENGEWRANDETATAESPTFTTAWAGNSVTVDTTLTTGLVTAARALLRQSSDLPTPRSIEFSPCHRHGPTNRAARMAAAAILDVLTPTAVDITGDRHKTVITTVTHRITPREWHTTVTLTPNQ